MYNIFKLPFICLFLVAAIGVGLPTSTANAQVGEKIPPDSSTYGLLEPDSQLDWITSSVAEDNDNSDNNDHSEEQDSQFIAEFKNFLNEDLDMRDDSNLPTTSTDMIIVGTANEAEVKIGLPTEAQLDSTGNLRGHS